MVISFFSVDEVVATHLVNWKDCKIFGCTYSSPTFTSIHVPASEKVVHTLILS